MSLRQLLANSKMSAPQTLGTQVSFSTLKGNTITLNELVVRDLYVTNIHQGDDALPDVWYYGCAPESAVLFSDGTAPPSVGSGFLNSQGGAVTPSLLNLVLLPEPLSYNKNDSGDPFQPYISASLTCPATSTFPVRESLTGYVYTTSSGANSLNSVPVSTLVPSVTPALNADNQVYGLFFTLNCAPSGSLLGTNGYRLSWYVIGSSTTSPGNLTPTAWSVPVVGTQTISSSAGYNKFPITFPPISPGVPCIQGSSATFPTSATPIPLTSGLTTAAINPVYAVSSYTPQATLNTLWANLNLVDSVTGQPTCSQGIWVQQIWWFKYVSPQNPSLTQATPYNVTHLFTSSGNYNNGASPALTDVGLNKVNSFTLGQRQPDESFTINIELPQTLLCPATATQTPYYLKQYQVSPNYPIPDLTATFSTVDTGAFVIILGTVSDTLSPINTQPTTNTPAGEGGGGYGSIWPIVNYASALGVGGCYAASPGNYTKTNAFPIEPTVAYGMNGVSPNPPSPSTTGVLVYPFNANVSNQVKYPNAQMIVCALKSVL